MKEKVLVGLASLMLLASCGGTTKQKLESISVESSFILNVKTQRYKDVEVNTNPKIEGLDIKPQCEVDYSKYLTFKLLRQSGGEYVFRVQGLAFKEQKTFDICFTANDVKSNICAVTLEQSK